MNRQAIQSIGFHLASFDLDKALSAYSNADYDALIPSPLRAPVGTVAVALHQPAGRPCGPGIRHGRVSPETAFRVAGISVCLPDPSVSAQLQGVLVSNLACVPGDFPPGGVPADYPAFPNDAGVSKHTCIGADFVTNHNSNLALDVRKTDRAEPGAAPHDDGLQNMPDWIPATIASTATDSVVTASSAA